MVLEKTFVAIKPDGVKRSLVGEIIKRFENVGLKIIGLKLMHVDKDFAKKHYSEHLEKFFYPYLEKYITSGPVIAIVLEGDNAITNVRKLVGDTIPEKSLPGTIRGDFSHMSLKRGDEHQYGVVNIIHASSSKEDAEKEIHLWFSDSELYDNYKTVHDVFL